MGTGTFRGSYSIQYYQANNALHQISSYPANAPRFDKRTLHKLIQDTAPHVRDIIMTIPVPVESAVHEARTPFSTYFLVKSLCLTVQQEVVWLDRYFDHNIFHRFFSDTPETAIVTLVTLPASSATTRQDQARVASFRDISRLFAQQRGTAGYRLIENDNFHDRWLRCDDKYFALGGSIKDLAKSGTFTITRMDSTPENKQHFDAAVSGGTEVFGPNAPHHP